MALDAPTQRHNDTTTHIDITSVCSTAAEVDVRLHCGVRTTMWYIYSRPNGDIYGGVMAASWRDAYVSRLQAVAGYTPSMIYGYILE